MITVCLTAAVVCALLIGIVLWKPSVVIKGHSISIYWMVVLAGVLFLMAMGYLTPERAFSGLTAHTGMNPIQILILFLSMTILSIYLDEVGMFRYLAAIALLRAKSSQKQLFLYLYIMVSVLTVFTSNDIIILTFTPFICYFAKNAKINPIPYLFGEFVAANTWSMMFLIGNPTNVYLSACAGIDFLQYFRIMWFPTLLAGVVAYGLLYVIFRKELTKPLHSEILTVSITDFRFLLLGIFHLAVCTVLLIISSYVGLEMWLITLGFAISLFVCTFVLSLLSGRTPVVLLAVLKRAPWELVPFVISMFLLVLTLDDVGAAQAVAKLLGTRFALGKYGVASFLVANIMNNIPMSVAFSSLTGHLKNAGDGIYYGAVYASVIGSNIGAYLSPLGALAGIMWTGIMKQQKVDFSFRTYIGYGIRIAPPVLLAALLGLQMVL